MTILNRNYRAASRNGISHGSKKRKTSNSFEVKMADKCSRRKFEVNPGCAPSALGWHGWPLSTFFSLHVGMSPILIIGVQGVRKIMGNKNRNGFVLATCI
jgi:hypothetical protein